MTKIWSLSHSVSHWASLHFDILHGALTFYICAAINAVVINFRRVILSFKHITLRIGGEVFACGNTKQKSCLISKACVASSCLAELHCYHYQLYTHGNRTIFWCGNAPWWCFSYYSSPLLISQTSVVWQKEATRRFKYIQKLQVKQPSRFSNIIANNNFLVLLVILFYAKCFTLIAAISLRSKEPCQTVNGRNFL